MKSSAKNENSYVIFKSVSEFNIAASLHLYILGFSFSGFSCADFWGPH